MIQTVGELLQSLKEKEEKKLSTFPFVTHGPTIGDMYEGATRKLLDAAIFDGLNIKVVEGFIQNSKKEISKQIDCMVVTGEGVQIPNTDHYIYDLPKVLAIIEVKKTMYGADLKDSLLWSRDFKDRILEPPELLHMDMLREAWRNIVGTDLPERDKLSSIPLHLQMIYHTLVVEACMPLRMFIGYQGYVNEKSFRTGLLSFLEETLISGENRLAGPGSFPDLMICRNATIFKLNGMPYPGPITPTNFWCYLGSRDIKPLNVMLEFLWTRISYKCHVTSNIFGDDLEREGVNLLLAMKYVEKGDIKGWEYNPYDLSVEELNQGSDSIPWEPTEVSDIEFALMHVLMRKMEIDINDRELNDYISSKGADPKEIIQGLCEKRLIYNDNSKLKFLTDECAIMFLPDGKAVAGENKSGRMERWLLKRAQRRAGGC